MSEGWAARDDVADGSAFATGEFHAASKFSVLVLPHFFLALLDDTRHEPGSSGLDGLSVLIAGVKRAESS